MRAWGLWQVARAYQATNKKKALRLLDAALAENAPKMQEEMMRAMNGTQAKPTRTWLQEQIARTIIMIDPSRADELLQTLDATTRGPILNALMSYYERHKLMDRAVEQFYRIVAEDEAPYAAAIRIIANLKPYQSGELAGIFGACLESYRAHAPHDFPVNDQFPQLVMTYWQRAPQPARDAIDEILRQAQDSKENSTFGMSFDKSNRVAGFLLEYRLAQLMPAMRELEAAKTREYLEKFPSVAELAESYATSTSGSTASDRGVNLTPGFRVNGCMLLRQARQISELWTFKLLKEIDNPQLRSAAEIAVASSALNVPESRTIIITSKRKSFSMSLGADLPESSPANY